MENTRYYPSGFVMRNNYFAPLYCEMAMEAFYEVIKQYSKLRADKWLVSAEQEFSIPENIHKQAAITVVFSAMSVEAFINNYLSVRMGDTEFLNEFGGRSYIVKLTRIMSMLRSWGKEEQWYNDVRELFAIRNEYVHSYSSETPVAQLIERIKDADEREEAIARVAAAKEKDESDIYAQYHAVFFAEDSDDVGDGEWPPEPTSGELRLPNDVKNNIKCWVADARIALVALCNFTRYMSHNDPNTKAFTSTFTPNGHDGHKKEIRDTAFAEIKTFMQNRTKR